MSDAFPQQKSRRCGVASKDCLHGVMALRLIEAHLEIAKWQGIEIGLSGADRGIKQTVAVSADVTFACHRLISRRLALAAPRRLSATTAPIEAPNFSDPKRDCTAIQRVDLYCTAR